MCVMGNPYFIFCWELILRAYWMTASKWGFAGVWQVLYLNRMCVNQNFAHFIKHFTLCHKSASQLWLCYVSTSFLLNLSPLFSCQAHILMICPGWNLNQWGFLLDLWILFNLINLYGLFFLGLENIPLQIP